LLSTSPQDATNSDRHASINLTADETNLRMN
jgi:hypothetical protein